MAFFRASTFSLIAIFTGWLVSAAGQNHHHTHQEFHLREHANVSTNASLAAPYYRNVSPGAAWVVPNSAYNLGARDMRCECFNPNDTCCMPKSKGLAPFCIPKGSVCCSDTFCLAHETCCADACCKPDTACTYAGNAPGCCPHGKTCSGSATCYDHFSPNCFGDSITSYCCIPHAPFCRNLSQSGFGCYASSVQTAATTGGAPTSGVQTVSSTTSTKEIKWLTTVTETITLEPIGTRKYSTIVTQTAPLLDNQSITSASKSTTSRDQTTTTSSVLSTTTITLSSSIPSTITISSVSTTPSSSKSALCFNADSQSPVACTPSPSSSSDDGPSIPGQIVFRSQAASLLSSHYCLLSITVTILVLTTYGVATSTFLVREDQDQDSSSSSASGEERVVDRDRISVVQGSGRVLRGDLGREISVVEGSAKVWKDSVVVDKSKIRILEGSGRAIGDDGME